LKLRRPKNYDKILSLAWELVECMQQYFRDDPLHTWETKYRRLYSEIFDKLAAAMFTSKELQEHISHEELRDAFGDICYATRKKYEELAIEDVRAFLDRFYKRPGRYRFFFPARNLRGYLDGYVVGECTLHSFGHLPQNVQHKISSEWKYTYPREKEIYESRSQSAYENSKMTETYFCVEVRAFGRRTAIETATRLTNQGRNILKCFHDISHLPRLREYYFTKGRAFLHIGELRYMSGWEAQPPDLFPKEEKYVSLISRLVRNRESDEIARKCISAIDICGMIEPDTPNELSFLLSVIAIECLLLGRDDRDSLGWKLREKIAMLLGDTPEWFTRFLNKANPTQEECDGARIDARENLSKRVADMYNKRSRFAHPDVHGLGQITEQDLYFASWVLELTLQKLLTLRERGITHVHRNLLGDPKSLDSFIDRMKYSAVQAS